MLPIVAYQPLISDWQLIREYLLMGWWSLATYLTDWRVKQSSQPLRLTVYVQYQWTIYTVVQPLPIQLSSIYFSSVHLFGFASNATFPWRFSLSRTSWVKHYICTSTIDRLWTLQNLLFRPCQWVINKFSSHHDSFMSVYYTSWLLSMKSLSWTMSQWV